ncbi:MAG: hypothetical protein AB1422_03150 [bacterium]
MMENKVNEPKIEIKINGKKIPLGHFVADFMYNTLLAMVSSLKGVKNGIIEIRLKW